MFKNKNIFVTGGTGSFGKSFVKKLLIDYKPNKIIIYSRDELKQFEMQNSKSFSKHNKILRYFIGDVRDKERLMLALDNEIDFVVHAAALKQVPTAEYNPFEAVKTNIFGAQNIIEACLEKQVKKVIALSTDKAAAPINLYGATKLTSDKLFIAANNYVGKKNMKFSVVRYGNVFGSRGSVAPFFLNQKEKGYLTLTDKNMTRFNITLDEGVKFVIRSFENMLGGEIFVPKIPSFWVTDLIKAIDSKIQVKNVGIRPGEKIHEEMITFSDSMNTIEFKDHYVILNDANEYLKKNIKYFKNKKRNFKKIKLPFSYNSYNNNNFLSINQLIDLISTIDK